MAVVTDPNGTRVADEQADGYSYQSQIKISFNMAMGTALISNIMESSSSPHASLPTSHITAILCGCFQEISTGLQHSVQVQDIEWVGFNSRRRRGSQLSSNGLGAKKLISASKLYPLAAVGARRDSADFAAKQRASRM